MKSLNINHQMPGGSGFERLGSWLRGCNYIAGWYCKALAADVWQTPKRWKHNIFYSEGNILVLCAIHILKRGKCNQSQKHCIAQRNQGSKTIIYTGWNSPNHCIITVTNQDPDSISESVFKLIDSIYPDYHQIFDGPSLKRSIVLLWPLTQVEWNGGLCMARNVSDY